MIMGLLLELIQVELLKINTALEGETGVVDVVGTLGSVVSLLSKKKFIKGRSPNRIKRACYHICYYVKLSINAISIMSIMNYF